MLSWHWLWVVRAGLLSINSNKLHSSLTVPCADDLSIVLFCTFSTTCYDTDTHTHHRHCSRGSQLGDVGRNAKGFRGGYEVLCEGVHGHEQGQWLLEGPHHLPLQEGSPCEDRNQVQVGAVVGFSVVW